MQYDNKLLQDKNYTPQELVKAYHYVLYSILRDLPSNKDWLDPDIEKIGKHILSKTPIYLKG